MPCIFCQIVAGEAPCFRIHEDDLTLTFLDLFPVSRGHTLIIPKAHCQDLFEIEPGALGAVAQRSLSIAAAIRSALAPDGISVFQLNGAAAGQTVFHYHMHLIPRMQGDALEIHSRVRGEEEDLRQVAAMLTEALRD
ncbi:HIT family protein [Myxococcota bacterium]|nr:HIT family protein [Myxococcota bacterium]